MAENSAGKDVRIAGQPFFLRSRDVLKAVRGIDPDPIASHFIVVGSRRYPPKQVISAMTGLDRADFTTHQARRTLMRLGFAAGRRKAADSIRSASDLSGDAPGGLAAELRGYVGLWVAIKDEDVLHAAESPQALVSWLARHGQKADSVFRVPEDELAATGLAPL